VKTRKTKNDRTRLHARREEGCPWRLKIGFDLQRSGGYVFTRAGAHIHCSTYGKSWRNKKDHIKFVQKQMAQQLAGITEEDEEYDIPDIMLVSNWHKIFYSRNNTTLLVTDTKTHTLLHCLSLKHTQTSGSLICS
jgi:hypothetical protein